MINGTGKPVTDKFSIEVSKGQTEMIQKIQEFELNKR